MTTAAAAAEPETSGAEVVHDALAEGCQRFDEGRRAFGEDDPDAVHDLRVSLRRMRSALRTFAPLLRRELTDPVAAELRWLGAVLGEARDLEVLDEWLHQATEQLPPGEARATAVAHLVAEVDARRDRTHDLAGTALAGERVARLRTDLQGLVGDLPVRRGAMRPAVDTVPGLLARDTRRLLRALHDAAERQRAVDAGQGRAGRHARRGHDAVPPASLPTDAHHAWHTARKRAKELRYACETADEVLGERAQRLGEAAKAVQSALGELQDSVVAREVIAAALASPLVSQVDSAALGHLYQREVEVEDEVLEQVDGLVAQVEIDRFE